MADKKKKKGLFGEFKEFIMRGNVLDMAVGIIIGGAFTAIVNSLVDDIINPLIALIGGDAVKNIDQLSVTMAHGVELHYGNFIGAIINFLLVALVLFAIIKGINTAREKMEKVKEDVAGDSSEGDSTEEAAAPAPTEAELLAQIRDLLAEEAKKAPAEAADSTATTTDGSVSAPAEAPQA